MKTYINRFLQNNQGYSKDKGKATQYFVVEGALKKVASSPNAYQIVTSQLKKLFKQSQQNVDKLDELFRQDIFKHNNESNERKQQYIKLILKYKQIRRLQMVLILTIKKRQLEVKYNIDLIYNELENSYIRSTIRMRDTYDKILNLNYNHAEQLLKLRRQALNDIKLRMTIYKNNLVAQLKIIDQILHKLEQ